MHGLARYAIAISIAANQFGNALTGGSPIETVSSRLGYARAHGSTVGSVLCSALNVVDHHHEQPGEDHCGKAIRHQRERQISPTREAFDHMLEQHVLPEDWSDVPGEDLAPQLARLTAWATRRGIVIETRSLAQIGEMGYALEHSIVLSADLETANARFYTLVHELTHVLGPQTGDPAMNEVLAELAAVQTCQIFGVNVFPQTARYLQFEASPAKQHAAIAQYATDVDGLVRQFTKAARE